MKTNRYLIYFTLIISSLFFVACESEDDEKILGAQNCFNGLSDSIAIGDRPAAVAACNAKLGNLSSPESQLLRCGMEFWVGGLDTLKISTAFDAQESVPDNQKEANLISALALTGVGAVATANSAYNYCSESGSAGMTYVAAMVKLGTDMEAVGGGGSPDAFIDSCIASPGSCATPANGQLIIDVAGIYCLGESEDNDVCQAMTSVINANPGNPQGVIDDFLSQINF